MIRNRRGAEYVVFCLVSVVTLWLFWPFFKWLAGTWRVLYKDTFGYVVPFISVWAVFKERKNILSTPGEHSDRGWMFFLPGLLLALLSRTYENAVGASLAFPLYCYGVCLLVWGKNRSRYLVFPLFLCIFFYPWDTLIESLVGFHLRLISTWMAFGGLKMVGLAVSISGTLIDTKAFSIDVAPACSGMTILKVLFFAGAIGGYIHKGNRWQKSILWASTVPLAVLLNMLRIISMGLIGNAFSPELAASFFHEVSGLLFFGVGLLSLYWESALMKRL